MHASLCFSSAFISLIAFEIRCIGRVLLVLGSRLKNEVNMHASLCFSSVFIFTDCFCNSVYWQRTVSSRLTLKERGIHTRFPVFILRVYFHCMLFVATQMQAVTITVIRCNCRMETLLVRSWIKLSIRRIERIGRIDKLARAHCH